MTRQSAPHINDHIPGPVTFNYRATWKHCGSLCQADFMCVPAGDAKDGVLANFTEYQRIFMSDLVVVPKPFDPHHDFYYLAPGEV